jgi:quercetin dioxygenase-like cupin family protein
VPEQQWVPQAANVAFLPLCFGVTQGYYVNLLRVRKSGVLSCHRHFGAVHAHVIKGRWFYMEHDWVATEGSFVMETPGETHTLVVPDDVPEMITWFHVAAGYVYFEGDRMTGYEDVFTKLQRAREHYEEQGLPQADLDRLVR